MNTQEIKKEYEGFKKVCDDFCNSKFIMCNNAMSALLRYLVNAPTMWCIFESNFSIEEYNKQLQFATDGGYFRLPRGAVSKIVLVVRLLYDFDRGNKNFHNFLQQFYPSGKIDASFSNFCNSALTPMCLAYKSVLFDNTINEAEEEKDYIVTDVVREQIAPFVASLAKLVADDNALTEEVKEEYIVMLDGLHYVLEVSQSKLVKVVWMGVKAMMAKYKPARRYLNDIDNVLVSYAVI